VGALEEQSNEIHDPVAKLKFIRSSLARYEETDRRLQELPSPLRALAEKVTTSNRCARSSPRTRTGP